MPRLRVWALLLPLASGASLAAPEPPPLLAACWAPEQVRGGPEDKRIRTRLAINRAAPATPAQARPPVPLAPEAARSIRSVLPQGDDKPIALTFDLCESAGELTGDDADLVAYLREQGVPATFYAGGQWMRDHPDRTQQLMADPLFELGTHGWTHGNLRVLRGQALEDQIGWSLLQYQTLREELLAQPCAQTSRAAEQQRIPPLPATFRFPYGACDQTALDAVVRAGQWPVQWSLVSGDPVRGQSPKALAKHILAAAKPGAIMVAHANGRGWATAQALPLLVPQLRERGYRFVTVSQLLAAGEPVSVDSCYENRPGDNLRYDRRSGAGTP